MSIFIEFGYLSEPGSANFIEFWRMVNIRLQGAGLAELPLSEFAGSSGNNAGKPMSLKWSVDGGAEIAMSRQLPYQTLTIHMSRTKKLSGSAFGKRALDGGIKTLPYEREDEYRECFALASQDYNLIYGSDEKQRISCR